MMKIYKFGEKIEGKISLCLGYFDSLHKGHRKLFDIAKSANGELSVFTFASGMEAKKRGVVYTFSERLEIFEKLGVKNLIVADFDKIKDVSCEDFISELKNSYEISNITCGFDYKFGKGAVGDVNLLKTHFESKLSVCEKVDFESEKASSNIAKSLIEKGEVAKLKNLLGSEYFISGYCEKGFQNGTKLGFPTANIKPSEEKILLREGVYIGKTKIDEKIYKSMINVGKIPTFGGEEYKIETHCIGISQPLYGKHITVFFERFLRESVKFSSVEELKKQLEKDIKELI